MYKDGNNSLYKDGKNILYEDSKNSLYKGGKNNPYADGKIAHIIEAFLTRAILSRMYAETI